MRASETSPSTVILAMISGSIPSMNQQGLVVRSTGSAEHAVGLKRVPR